MSDIFREVEEDLRHDRIKEAWDKYGNYLIAFAVLIAALTGGYQFWQKVQNDSRNAQSENFLAALELLETGSTEAAQDAFKAIKQDGSGGYKALAAFQQAGLYVRNDDLEGAIKAYDSLSIETGVDQMLKDLAKIKAAQLLMDTGSRADLEARIGSLTVDTNPWRFAAQEILAFVAFRDGDIRTAYDDYTALSQEISLTPEMRQRVEEMRLVIGPMALEPMEAAADEAAMTESELGVMDEAAPSGEAN